MLLPAGGERGDRDDIAEVMERVKSSKINKEADFSEVDEDRKGVDDRGKRFNVEGEVVNVVAEGTNERIATATHSIRECVDIGK